MTLSEVLLLFFISVLFVQLLYWLLFSKLVFYKSNLDNQSALKPPVSVVICAINEEKNLKELIPQILEQDYPEFELIIVDDRSTDDSYDYLIGLRDDFNNIKIVKVDAVPDHMDAKKYAITLGVKAANNDVLLFTDADCRVRSKNWIKRMVSNMDDTTSIVLGFSPYKSESSILNLMIAYETMITAFHYLSAALWSAPYMGVGRNLIYRKSLFLEKKGFNGFNNVTGGDDDLFVNRHATGENCRICIDSDAVVDSFPKKNWSSYFKQKRRHLSVGKHYRIRDKWRLGLFTTSQILFWICFVTLASLQVYPYVVFGGFGLRLIIQIAVVGIGSKKLSNRFPVFLLPVSDLIYSVYLPVLGIPALISKKIKWS